MRGRWFTTGFCFGCRAVGLTGFGGTQLTKSLDLGLRRLRVGWGRFSCLLRGLFMGFVIRA